MYKIENENLFMIPTAEVPITNIYRKGIILNEELPIKNVAYTPCFRKEAGSWGVHVRGLNRLHLFDKVEIVHIESEKNYTEGFTFKVYGKKGHQCSNLDCKGKVKKITISN